MNISAFFIERPIFAGVIALFITMIGALAGGEERQLGVHDAQLLLPMSSRRQWMVKVATSLGLGAVLTILLPLILVTVLPPEAMQMFGRRGLIQAAPMLMLPTLVTLATAALGVWDPGNATRALLAIPLGVTVGAVVAAVAAGDLR